MSNQPAKSFRDLIVWNKAHQFVLLVYQFTSYFPASETYGLSGVVQKRAILGNTSRSNSAIVRQWLGL
jgi:hypothetical protein